MSLLGRCLPSTQTAEDKQVSQVISIVRSYLFTVGTFPRVFELTLTFLFKRTYI